jgi:hypothetical protein
MKNIYLFVLVLPIKAFPFTNHVLEIFFGVMIIDMLFNNKFQIFFIWKEYRAMVLMPMDQNKDEIWKKNVKHWNVDLSSV